MRHNWAVVHPNNKIAWVPVLRNGNRFYKSIFTRNKWTVKNYGTYNDVEKFFCHVRHPKERLVRGIASAIINFYDPQTFLDCDINHKSSLFYLKIFHDDHIYPISYQFYEILPKLDCIYLTHPQYSSEELTTKYLKKQGIDIQIDNNSSSYNKTNGNYLEVQNKLLDLLHTGQGKKFYLDYLQYWLKSDFELYKRANANL